MDDRTPIAESALLRKVAVPTEHGGWSLTLEPALLGSIVAPSWAGAALALAGLLAFVLRTPLKISLGDRLRRRRLPRTKLADRVVGIESVALASVVVVAALVAENAFWAPLLAAAPLFAIELWFDIRSKSRRLLPELAGTIGIGSVAAAIALAGGTAAPIAHGLWAIAAARAMAAIPFVRTQLRRAKGQRFSIAHSDVAQLIALVVVAVGFLRHSVSGAAVAAIAALATVHVVLVRRPAPKAPVLGAQQVVVGLAVVLVAGLGAVAP